MEVNTNFATLPTRKGILQRIGNQLINDQSTRKGCINTQGDRIGLDL